MTFTNAMTAIIGFAESFDQLKELNNKKTYPFNFNAENIEKISEIDITPDIFSPCYLEGRSNFQDYLRTGTKVN